jgi:2-polyprenyl-6-methoxyphenol hydroxylase-like FAD-dependent oxidoreductase
MAAVRRVLIQGGGVGGLTLAAALGQRGVEVDVLEAAGPEAVLGVGLNQPANALAALEEIGVRDACLEVGIAFEPLSMWTPAGSEVAVIPPAAGRYGTPSNNGISRPAYGRLPRRPVPESGPAPQSGT